MNQIVFEAVGEKLIEQYGLTKAEFARRMGIQRQNVKAVFKSSKLDTIRRVAEALEVDLMDLLGYREPVDLSTEPFVSGHSKRTDLSTAVNIEPLEILPEDVPTGDSVEDRLFRRNIIYSFYCNWKQYHPDQCLFNTCLNDYINIRSISIEETAEHASKSYLSTLAVFQLDAILTHAKLVSSTSSKQNNRNQCHFEKMLIMEYGCTGIGKVKLTVGVRRSDKMKVQYCITSIDSVRTQSKQPR